MLKILITIFVCIACIGFISCGNDKHEHADEQAEENEHHSSNTAILTKEQVHTIGIEFGEVEAKQLTSSLKANGVLQVPNQNKASINSVYGGVITSLAVQPGNSVKKGQTIATIANPEFIQIQDEYLGINSKITLAEQELTRQKELNAGNAGALKNLQAAENNLQSFRSRKSSLQQQIRLMGINPELLKDGKLLHSLAVKTPISGIVSEVMVKMGSYVDVSTPIADIVDNSQLHLDLFVYEKDLHRLKNNQTIHFTLTNNPGREYDAEIYSLGSSFEGASKAVSVHAKVKGDKTGLIDGMNITAVISLENATKPAVPSDAIVTSGGQDYIFIVTDSTTDQNEISFEKIPVVKGTTDVGFTEITLLEQIPAAAKIVVKGAFFVLAKMTNEGEGEHAH